jgi:hypothetical protein
MTLEIGIRIDMEKGLAFFGVEEVNRKIASGAKLRGIKPGGAVMQPMGGDGDHENVTLVGCQFQVVFEDA